MSLVKKIIKLMAKLVHAVVNLKVISILKTPSRVFYYYWIAEEFASCGDNCYFEGFSQLMGQKYISLGNNLYIGKDVVWEIRDNFNGQFFSPCMSIGHDSSFGDGGHITCVNKIQIGNGVRIGRKVFITDNSHGAFDKDQLKMPAHTRPICSKGPVIIEDNVWIGEMSCVMPGVTIGEGTIVAANSVVTKNTPPYCVVAGTPAKIIKQL